MNTTTNMSGTLNVQQTADMMNVHPNTVFKLIETGALPAALIGRAYVLLTKDVMDYIERIVVLQTAKRMGGTPTRLRRRSPKFVGQV